MTTADDKDVRIEELQQVVEVSDDDILIVSDTSLGNKTRSVRKADLLREITKNVTDDETSAVINTMKP